MKPAPALEKNVIVTVDKDGLARRMKKVFIADDDVDYTRKITTALKGLGFETKSVNSFALMEETLKNNQYPINLIDNIEGDPTSSTGITGSDIILQKPHLFENA